jgi:hypothetical protein
MGARLPPEPNDQIKISFPGDAAHTPVRKPPLSRRPIPPREIPLSFPPQMPYMRRNIA